MNGIAKVAKKTLLTRFNDLVVETTMPDNSQARIDDIYDLVRFVKYDVVFYAINNTTVEQDIWTYIRGNEPRLHLVMSITTTIRLELLDEFGTDDNHAEPMDQLADNIAQSLAVDRSTASFIDYETKNRLLDESHFKYLFRANHWLITLFLITQIPINHLINYYGTERTE